MLTIDQINRSGACAQCRSNASNNLAGGYERSARECLDYCARGHRMPEIVVGVVPSCVAQATIAGADRRAVSIALRIANVTLDLLAANTSWSLPYVREQEGATVLRIEGVDASNADEIALAMWRAAIMVAGQSYDVQRDRGRAW